MEPERRVVSATQKLLCFGVFELHLDALELRKLGTAVKLPPQPVQLLGLLVSRAGQVVSRNEIQAQLWPDDPAIDYEHVVNKCIKQIRNVLGDDADSPLYIETLPRQGYRFIAPVTSKNVPSPQVRISDSAERKRPPVLEARSEGGYAWVAEVAPPDVGSARPRVTSALEGRRARRWRAPLAWTAAAVLLIGVVAAGLYWRAHRTGPLGEKDTIIIADFVNQTGDPAFDYALQGALTIALRQSPFLSILSGDRVTETLKQMTRDPDTPVTGEVAREVCQRTNSKAYIAGSIAGLGTQYVLGLKAINCQTGDLLAQEVATAPAKEKVLEAMRASAARLRRELGETLGSVQKFDVPLAPATTSVFEALKESSLGTRIYYEKGPAAALLHDQRAVELDPNFAIAYLALGTDYDELGEPEKAKQYLNKAFELDQHVTEREKLTIAAHYYESVTGDLDKAAGAYQEQIDAYPRSAQGYLGLGHVRAEQGQYEDAARLGRKAVELVPGNGSPYVNLTIALLGLERLEQAGKTIQQAQQRSLEDYQLRASSYALAFLAGNTRAMSDEASWFVENLDYETVGLELESNTQAYYGRLQKARHLTRKAVASAVQKHDNETAAGYLANAALREAAFGNRTESRQLVDEALKLAPASMGVRVEAALALAMTGDVPKAESLTQSLNQQYPQDTQLQALWLPAIRAQLASDRNRPAQAIEQLQASGPIELGTISFADCLSCLFPAYVRGQAYLAAGDGAAAAAEFQKVLNHGGIAWNCFTGALAKLGLARAEALSWRSSGKSDAGAQARARSAYQAFLDLWKDADADIPIYAAARLEYAQLR